MSWVNLDDAYVNKTGDTIAGDLSVNGTLNINNGKGTDTTYNVANEITTLKNSTSKLAIGETINNITLKKADNGNFEIWFNTDIDSVCIYFNLASIGVYNGKTQGGFNIKP